MNHILLLLLVLFDGIGSIGKIARENTLKKEAEEAFMNKDYKTAIAKFSFLTDTLKVVDEKATLNLGHAYYRSNDFATAAKTYEKLYLSTDKNVKSVAAQQLGVLSFKADQDKEKALTFFKASLRANPNNAEARFNYEFLKKIQEAKKDPKMDDKNKKDDKKEEEKKDDKKEDEKKEDDKKEGDKKDDKKDGDKKENDKKMIQKMERTKRMIQKMAKMERIKRMTLKMARMEKIAKTKKMATVKMATRKMISQKIKRTERARNPIKKMKRKMVAKKMAERMTKKKMPRLMKIKKEKVL